MGVNTNFSIDWVKTNPAGEIVDISVNGQNLSVAAELDDNKTASYTTNGEKTITPSTGKDGMKKATVTINVPTYTRVDETTVTIDGDTYVLSEGE